MKSIMGPALAIVLATCGLTGAAQAEYPERPVTFIVPWPPGNLEDELTRIIADAPTEETGVPGKAIKRPGGGAVEGATFVAQATPDGYTVGSFVLDVPTVQIIKNVATYDRSTFVPVGIFLTYPFALVARGDAPYSDLASLADYAKANPVKLSQFGYDVIPTMETLEAARQLGFEFAADTPADMLDCALLQSGDVDLMATSMALVLPCLDSVKVLAAYADTPLSLAPDAKLLSEQIPGLDITLWNGLFVPKDTPQEVIDRIAQTASKAMQSEKAQDVAKNTGAGVYWIGPDEAAKRIDADYAAAEKLVAAAQ
ncbi:tripartite tricarboxylate transporter substrate binding protein [Defluviimonas sp. WL0002]|uniref:Tripartite tricarboxylate transporter substrate binding protein n=1 Tax=Albidovulum marisflavi TaxID=2984159 RepID=A0ABT2ZDR0_9RHOB|nr:tripartite tricarboxylate transporter substrate binding protein [Defluviimonas sp. WL0002]MCV2869278.1 tripartite tricarboxylate transporter substrate binding protein [Defluviimonas sp. WL0002]